MTEETAAAVRALIRPMRREPREGRKAKPSRGKGGRKVESVKAEERESQSGASRVSERAKHDAEARARKWGWAEPTIWTERMLAALENGVKGSK